MKMGEKQMEYRFLIEYKEKNSIETKYTHITLHGFYQSNHEAALEFLRLYPNCKIMGIWVNSGAW